jgi:phosphoesterase RecJ-like protein
MALGYEIMNIYLSNDTLETSTPDRNDLVVLQFMISLDSNYQKERSVAFYASEQCITYSYFSQIVKEKTGHSALHWIVQKVITDAKHMLEYTHASVKEFADKLIAEADVICCLDFNAIHRIDAMGDAVLASPARKILIDHHLHPEDFCKIIISHPEISSTSELVFRLICRMGYFSDISREGAECIYTGMMTDTGGFTYNSNNREIYFIISELLSKGIDKDEIYRKVFNTYSESRLRLMGYVLSQMKVYPDYHAALISLTKAEQSQFDYVRGDSEGFVNIPLSIKGVIFSCFLREDTEKPMIKISLRSVGTFPCNQLAAEFFGGGGHLNASGGEFYGTMDEARKVFEQALEKYKPLLNAKG